MYNTEEFIDSQIQFKIIEELKVVHFMGEGEFSFLYLMQNIQKVHQDSRWNDDYNTFIDFENVKIPFSSEGLEVYQEFFAQIQLLYGRRKWSIYTKNRETQQSASVTNLLQASTIGVDIFNVRDEALSYLGISPDKFYLFDREGF